MAVEPLVIEFEVGVPPAEAFATWTERCATWWPPSHTVSGNPAAIVFEPRAGGRIVERAPDGDEHPWGEVLAWEPPRRLHYLWHLFFTPEEATEVEVTFTPASTGTSVRLEQRGFERLGAAGPPRRAKTEATWSRITLLYRGALEGDPGGAGAGGGPPPGRGG